MYREDWVREKAIVFSKKVEIDWIVMDRLKAAGIHLLISVLIGAMSFATVWWILYPPPMLIAIGGDEIFRLIIMIDVIVGPLLTLVVFNTKKPSLKFDLAVIAAMQIAAMIYGFSFLYEARPVYVAALGDRFQVVQAPEVGTINLSKAKQTLPLFGPRWVSTTPPTDIFMKEEVKMVERDGGSLGHFPQFHAPYEDGKAAILQKARPISDLKSANTGVTAEIDKWLNSHGYTDATAKYQPINIVVTRYAVILDANTAAVVGIAPFLPAR
jgi:hypothetical protein